MSEGERDVSPFERLINSAEWEMEMQGWAGGAFPGGDERA